jgi:hypothetical protein
VLSAHIYQGKRIDNYRILAEISSSPINSVFLAVHPSHSQNSLVIKLFHIEHVSNQKRTNG